MIAVVAIGLDPRHLPRLARRPSRVRHRGWASRFRPARTLHYLLVRRREGGETSDLLLNDRPLLACVTLWVVAVVLIVYHPFILTMPDFNVPFDAVNVEQIISPRPHPREAWRRSHRSSDQGTRERQARVSRQCRADLLEQFRRGRPTRRPNCHFAFEDQTLFESTRGPLRFIRRLLLPILKLFFNPNPLIQALNIQSRLNATAAEREAKRDAQRYLRPIALRSDAQPRDRDDPHEHRGQEPEDAARIDGKPARVQRAARARARECRRVQADERRAAAPGSPARRVASRRQSPAGHQAERAAGAPASGGECPGCRGPRRGGHDGSSISTGRRDRRRRRARRAGGGAADADVVAAVRQPPSLTGQDQAETDQSADIEQGDGEDSAIDTAAELTGADDAIEPSADSRQSRPEPIEHAFGAQAHPDEPAPGDPATAPSSSSPIARDSEPQPEQPTSSKPSAPEQ